MKARSKITLRVADYTDMPVGRNDKDGPKNGLDYLEKHVVPALERFEHITIDFNETLGTTPSFLEEVFGGLIRKKHLSYEEYKRRISVTYKYKSVLDNIEKYVKEANEGTMKK